MNQRRASDPRIDDIAEKLDQHIADEETTLTLVADGVSDNTERLDSHKESITELRGDFHEFKGRVEDEVIEPISGILEVMRDLKGLTRFARILGKVATWITVIIGAVWAIKKFGG